MRVIIILILGIVIGGLSVWVWNNYRPQLVINPVTPTPSQTGIGTGTLELVSPEPVSSISATPRATPLLDPDEPMSASLDAVEGTGFNQSGGASLVEENGKVRVTILLNSVAALADPQPANIHVGTCGNVGAAVYTLNDVENGKSETLLTTSLSQIRRQMPLIVNVKQSSSRTNVDTACGPLK
jgi:hypothetical protein